MSRGPRRMSRILDARMRRLAMPVLVTLAAAIAHETTYRLDLALGGDYQEAMTAGGHGGYWPLLLGALVIAVTALGFVALRELRRLSTRARATARTGLDDDGCRTLVRIAAPMTLRLFALTAVAFVLQENIERIAAGVAAPGLDALATHGMAPLAFLGLAALAVGLVAALVCWRRHVIRSRLAATASRRSSRPPARSRRPGWSLVRAGFDIAAAGGIRAPPLAPRTA